MRKGGVSNSTYLDQYLDQYLTKGPSFRPFPSNSRWCQTPWRLCVTSGSLIFVSLHILFSQSFLMKFTKAVLSEHLLLCCGTLRGRVALATASISSSAMLVICVAVGMALPSREWVSRRIKPWPQTVSILTPVAPASSSFRRNLHIKTFMIFGSSSSRPS